MEKKTITKILVVICIIVFAYIGFQLGEVSKDNELGNDFLESIEYCEGEGSVLRVYALNNGKVTIECFGELPDVDVHFN